MAVVLTCSRSLSGLDPPGLASPRQGHLLVASKRYNAGGGGFMPLDGSRDWCGVFDGHAVPGVPPFSPAPLRPHPPLSLADTAAMASTPQTNRKLAVLHHAIGDGCTAADESWCGDCPYSYLMEIVEQQAANVGGVVQSDLTGVCEQQKHTYSDQENCYAENASEPPESSNPSCAYWLPTLKESTPGAAMLIDEMELRQADEQHPGVHAPQSPAAVSGVTRRAPD
uniref:Uncharacterized protein n=1 Tax=Oryza sativa subsp. japonica TaxID=39947 RepID=Q7XBS3_ORYSJ|nr:hypothetical protein LOC_Os10g42930 [Oryza sativa Japonica Group]